MESKMHLLRLKIEEEEGRRTWSKVEVKSEDCLCVRSSLCFNSPECTQLGNAGHHQLQSSTFMYLQLPFILYLPVINTSN